MMRFRHWGGALALSGALIAHGSVAVVAQDDKPGKAQPKEADDSDDLPKALGELPATVGGLAEAFAYQRELGQHDLAARYFMKFVAAAKAMEADKRPAELSPVITGEYRLQFNGLDRLTREVVKLDKGRGERLKAAVKEYEEMLAEVIRDNNATENLVKLAELVIEPSSYAQAIEGLRKLGGRGTALLLDVAVRTQEEGDRRIVTRALLELGADTIPALIGALNMPDPLWRQQVLAVLEARAEIGQDLGTIEPALWMVLADDKSGVTMKVLARRLLGRLLKTDIDRLPDSAKRLTQLAELFLRRKYPFSDPENLQVWRWTAKGLVAGMAEGAKTALVRRDEAEAYWGEKCARAAVALRSNDPRARQILLAFLMQSPPVPASAPLAAARPDLMALLAGQDVGTLEALLRLAMELDKPGMARHLLETFAARADSGPLNLYQLALDHGDRRVRMAAIEAIVRLPKPPSNAVAGKVVDTLTQFLAASNLASGKKGRAVVAMASPVIREEVTKALEANGRVVETLDTTRELVRRVRSAADIDLIVLDSNIPDPDLAGALAQLSADSVASRLPVVVIPAATPVSLAQISFRYHSLSSRRGEQEESVRRYLRERDELMKAQAAERAELEDSYAQYRKENKGKLTEEQQNNYNARLKDLREYQAKQVEEMNAINLLGRHAQEEIARIEKVQAILRAERNDLVLSRQQKLERHLSGQASVKVLGEGVATNPGLMRLELASWNLADSAALTDDEKKILTVKAAVLLGRMASGEIAGYDIRMAAGALDAASGRTDLPPEGALGVVAALAQLPGGVAQARLATIASNPAAPLPLRMAAADGLTRHARKNAKLITTEQVNRVRAARDQAEPQLKVALSGALAHLGSPLDTKASADYSPAKPAAKAPDAPAAEKQPEPAEKPKDN
mgnify:FL=1